MPRADLILRETASLQVIWEQAGDLIGQASSPVIKETPGDARGGLPLELYVRPNGGVWVGGVWVGGGPTAIVPAPKLRKALVAWLDKAPSKVYVTFAVNSD